MLGFLGIACLQVFLIISVICGGVILLQLAKAADKVSDAAQLSGDLDDVKAVTDVEKPEEDPGADAIRGALSIRRFSTIRRPARTSDIDSTGTAGAPIRLSNRSTWRRYNRNQPTDGHFLNVPSDWSKETIREVPAEEERRSSIQFDPNAPITHIYPPRQTRAHKLSPEDGTEEVDHSEREAHNPLSPVDTPDFLSAPPTPRYTIPKRTAVQKQFSFSRAGKRNLTEEETIGLVEAGQTEGVASEESDERESTHSHSEHWDDSDHEREREVERGSTVSVGTSGRRTEKSYDMI